MSTFKRVERATYPPRSCLFCGAFEGPLIDTETDIIPYGHVYICASTERRAGCVRQLARKDRMVAVEELMWAHSKINELEQQVRDLEARDMEFVPLKQVEEAFVSGALRGEE